MVDMFSEVWERYDYDRGPKDSPENRKDDRLADGFIYPCCDRNADSCMETGCKRGYHQAADGKRGRYDADDRDDADCPLEWCSDDLEDDTDEDDYDDDDDDE